MMSANSFAAIGPYAWGVGYGIWMPNAVGANDVGKFICRNWPVCVGYGTWMPNAVGAN